MGKRTNNADAGKAIALIRTSTDRQDLSVQAQRDAIAAWSRQNGVTIVSEYVETISGAARLDEREGLLQALAAVQAHGAGVLVVAKLDRFSRDPVTAALAGQELARAGAKLVCADGNGGGDDPTSELVRNILLAVAAFERQMIRARIKAAIAVKRSRGEVLGRHAPYGMRIGDDGKTLVPDLQEAQRKAILSAMRAEGLSLRDLAREAHARGIVARNGKPFAVSTLAQILAA